MRNVARVFQDEIPFSMPLVTAGLVLLGALITVAGERIVIAAPALLLAVVLTSWSPAGGVGAAMMAIPFVFDLHRLPRGSFSLLELGIMVTVAGFAIHMVLFQRTAIFRAIQRVLGYVEIIVPVVGILMATAIAMLNLADTSHRSESLREVRLVIVEPIMLLLVMLVVFEHRQARVWAVTCLVGIGVVLSFWAVGQVVTGSGVVDASSVERATASYPHPNNLGLFLDRSFLLIVPLLFALPRSRWVWALVLIQGFGLGMTFSRGSYAAVAVGIAIALLIAGYRKQIFWLGAAVTAVVAILLVFARDRLLDPGGGGHEPTRLAIWRSSWQMLRDHPLFGVGPDQFLYAYWRRYVEPIGWPERYTSHPHNMVLDVWLRLGVVGIASFTALVIGVGIMLRRIRAAHQDDWLVRGCFLALAGGVIHGMFDNSFFLADLATMTWLFVAVIAVSFHRRTDSSDLVR